MVAAVGSRPHICTWSHLVVPVRAASPGTRGLCTRASSGAGMLVPFMHGQVVRCVAAHPYSVQTADGASLVYGCTRALDDGTHGPTMVHLQCSSQASIRPESGLTLLLTLLCCPAALQAEPSNVKALLRRSTAREALAQLQPAAEDLRAALALQPGNKEAQQGLARLEAGMAAAGGAEAAAGEGGKQ